MRRAASAALLAIPLCTWTPAVAAVPQDPTTISEPEVPEKAGKILRAARVTGSVPTIDGQLDEEVWAMAESVTGLVQNDPDNMAPATERTVIQIAYDDRYVYIAVRCYSDRAAIATSLGRRDDVLPSDRLVIAFDPRHDHQTAYVFEVNPSGVQRDFALFDDTQINNDYDAVWDVVTRIAAEGWVAEYRIPFSQMRFDVPGGDEVVWGLNIQRDIRERGEQSFWVPAPRGAIGNVSRFGHLVFDGRLAPPRRVELMPFVLGSRADAPAAGADYGLTGGFDLRVGLGTSATFSATVNPDFGQVEQDPAVLNLSVFETFFPEKRPFFLEDSRLFVPQFEQFQLFHSRRIGSDDATILGAAKLVSRGAAWSYGVLTAVTDAAPTNGAPATSYSAGRLQRDVFGGSSNVGALATAVLRGAGADAFAGGVDYNLRWRDNRLFWNGQWAATHALRAGRMRAGVGGLTNAGYYGTHFGTAVRYERYDRHFDVHELGFHRNRGDKTEFEGRLLATQPNPWGPFRLVHTYVNVGQRWNGDDLLLWRQFQTGLNLTFRNYWDLFSWAGRQFTAFDDLDTRGGPPIVNPGETFGGVFLATDRRKTWRFTLIATTARGDEGRWYVHVGPTINFQPSGRLQASVGGVFNPAQQMAQWVANADTDGDGEIDFVYGQLRQDVLDLTARATFAVTRDLTLQLFLQPFVAVGDYSDIKRLAGPHTFDFAPAALAFDPDFNRKSVRSNVVLRWEYIRGSTLFVVWNTSTTDTARPGRFAPLRDLRTAFGGTGTHVAMVKLSYWLGR